MLFKLFSFVLIQFLYREENSKLFFSFWSQGTYWKFIGSLCIFHVLWICTISCPASHWVVFLLPESRCCPMLNKRQFQPAWERDLPLAKAKLMSNAGCTSVRAYFKKFKNAETEHLGEKNEKMLREPTLQTPSLAKNEGKISRCQSKSSLAAYGEGHGGTGGLGGVAAHVGSISYPHLSPGGAVNSWKTAFWPILEQFLKKCSLQEPHIGSFREGWHPMGKTPWWSRGRE